MIGTRVRLTKHAAKWFLEHPDAFEISGRIDLRSNYDVVMQMSIATLLGEDIIGVIAAKSWAKNIWKVNFKSVFGKEWSWYEYPKDIKLASDTL